MVESREFTEARILICRRGYPPSSCRREMDDSVVVLT